VMTSRLGDVRYVLRTVCIRSQLICGQTSPEENVIMNTRVSEHLNTARGVDCKCDWQALYMVFVPRSRVSLIIMTSCLFVQWCLNGNKCDNDRLTSEQ
jgi:hypothetical protein